ncbi:MAG TPA: membrane protein insertase YidC, partial [Pyrinomonadaceae bacterium]
MQQKRLILALILSSAILFLWTFFYPAPTPQNQNNQANSAVSESPQPTASATPSPDTANQQSVTSVGPSTAAPQRMLTIRTPLYEAKFDSRGAEPVSWIIKKNKRTDVQIYSSASTREKRQSLELISPAGLSRQPREVPLQLRTGDSALDAALSSSTYKIEGIDAADGDAELNLSSGQRQQVTFVLENANGVQVRKTVEFDADRYDTDLVVLVKRGTETVPVKLSIGPSIGDQGVSYHTFYSVAPEAIAFVNGNIERHTAAAINGNSKSPDHHSLNGPIDWAGVGDTYFAMVAVPYRRTEGLEYRTVAYEHKANGTPEKRFLISGLIPIASDGSPTVIYAGPKDHYLLTEASGGISRKVERPGPIDLDGLIDYGFLAWLSRPLAIPILQAIT